MAVPLRGDSPTDLIRKCTYRRPTANSGAGHLDLARSVCMTVAVLVLEPIFEADLPQSGTRTSSAKCPTGGGRGGRMFRGHPEVVDADLTDYFGSIPHAEY